MAYIQDKLTSLMIDYNQGFILKLSIQEKIELKEKIDSIDKMNIEQKDNNKKVQQQSSNSKNRLRERSNSHEEIPNIFDIMPDDQDNISGSKSQQQIKSKYQIESDLRESQFFKKAFE